MADECLRDGVFDYWEVCRPLLADPELIRKAAEDRLDEARRCIGSLNCLSRLFRDLPYTCTINPALGHEVEPEYAITPAAVKNSTLRVYPGGEAKAAGEFEAELAPNVDFSKIAEAFGAHGEKIADPADVPAALARCVKEVRGGRAALLHARVTKM